MTEYNKEQIIKELNNIILVQQEKDIINNIIYSIKEHQLRYYENSYPYAYSIFEVLFKMRYKLKYPTSFMGKYFDLTTRAIENKLKFANWSYTRQEAQQINSQLKDYKDIQTKSRKTILNKYANNISPEDLFREKINIKLNEQIEDSEIIVGISTYSIIPPKQIDIPIIIIKNNNTYKFAVEYNGTYWHKDEDRESTKKELTKAKGYEYFIILHDTNCKEQDIDSQLIEIINIIKSKIK